MDRRAESDGNVNLHDKSDDSLKVNRSFKSLEIFRHVPILDTLSDMHGWSRKIHLEAKNMKANFDVGRKNVFFFKFFKTYFQHNNQYIMMI